MMTDKEYIIASAIHYSKGNGTPPFHNGYGIDDGVVICGLRHPQCIHAATPWRKNGYEEVEQGFITSRGRFVNRKEAAQIAIAAKQISDTKCKYLFSEDVFPIVDNYSGIDHNYKEEWLSDEYKKKLVDNVLEFFKKNSIENVNFNDLYEYLFKE